MIPTFFLSILSGILWTLNYFLPTWTVWPASVEHAAILAGRYSYWLDPWVPMDDVWGAALFVSSFYIGVLFAAIFSRSVRLKIFKH